MVFTLMPLPYDKKALEPHISAETLDCKIQKFQDHHGKHHAGYVTKLNAAVAADPSLNGKSLEEIMMSTSGGVFNSAAQTWNHDFYWQSLSPNGGGEPDGELGNAINAKFGNVEAFKKEFTTVAAGHFGSGWAWLVKGKDGTLQVVGTHDASNPLKEDLGIPLLTCDVWEHAYYIDYRNSRPEYITSWWNLVNWSFASNNFSNAP